MVERNYTSNGESKVASWLNKTWIRNLLKKQREISSCDVIAWKEIVFPKESEYWMKKHKETKYIKSFMA